MTQTGPLTSHLSSSISSGEDSSTSPLREEMSPLQAPASLLGLPLRGLGGVGMPSFGGCSGGGKGHSAPFRLTTFSTLTSAILSSFLFLRQQDAGGNEGVSSLPSLWVRSPRAKSPSAQKIDGAQGEEAFQTLGPPAGAGKLVIPRLACMQTSLSPCWG